MTDTNTDATDDAATAAASTDQPTWDSLFNGEDPAKVKQALEESRKWEKRAKENSTAAARLAALEQAQITEAERNAQRAEAAEKELAAARQESLRARVAITKGVPADLVDRLRGDTEDDLAEDADRLLALIQPGKPRGDAAQGPRGDAGSAGPADDFARFIQRASR